MPGLPIGISGDFSDIPGLPGSEGFPIDQFVSITPTVTAMGRGVLTVGATIGPHGNPYDSNAPGFNPPCAASTIAKGLNIPTILVQGKPIAVVGVGVGSIAQCGHWLMGPGVPTILAGTGGIPSDLA
jgi:hypothetical protein